MTTYTKANYVPCTRATDYLSCCIHLIGCWIQNPNTGVRINIPLTNDEFKADWTTNQPENEKKRTKEPSSKQPAVEIN